MNKKFFLKGLFAAILSLTIATIFGSASTYAEAVVTRGLFTDSNDVRWEWEKIIDTDNTAEPETLSIMFYDKPASATTIVVPSLSDAITAANATSTLNTYYVRNADEEAQAANYTDASQAKRTSSADVTKLDMTNTSKVQIMGVKPILNPETEAELVFGENMVIGDEFTFEVRVTFKEYDPTNYSIAWCESDGGNCTVYLRSSEDVEITDFQPYIENYNNLSLDEKTRINYSDSGLYSCILYSDYIKENELDPSKRYCTRPSVYRTYKNGNVEKQLKKKVTAEFCSRTEERQEEYGRRNRYCTEIEERVVEDAVALMTGSNLQQYQRLTLEQKRSYKITNWDLGCRTIPEDGLYYSNTATCYMPEGGKIETENVETIDAGAFAGYKLKLTNLENVKYIGWYAFQHATFNEASRDITIKANQTAGEGVFAWTNAKSATFEGTRTFPAMFRDCPDLTEINIDSVEEVSYDTFLNTNLGSIDLSNTNVKTILGGAFMNANLSSVNLEGVQSIGFESFRHNNLTELYLPKSITDLNSAKSFYENPNLTKLTIAFDTMLMKIPLHAAMGEYGNNRDGYHTVVNQITELNLIAPYAENEEIAPGRREYSEIAQKNVTSSGGWRNNDDVTFAHANDYKNVIAPGYFYGLCAVEKLTIGEGYEFVGHSAFYQYYAKDAKQTLASPQYGLSYLLSYADRNYTGLKSVSLPESLKGIGQNAFSMHYGYEFNTINFPEGLEYIGNFAFANDAFFTNDFDLPNLRYLGSHAFWINGLHNIVLHDSLEHVGYSPFMGSWNLNDMTIDYDVFRVGHLFDGNGDGISGNGHFGVGLTEMANSTYDVCHHADSRVVSDYYPETTRMGMPWGMCVKKLGNLTFTEKVQTEPTDDTSTDYYTSFGGRARFYQMAAHKIDLSKTGWKRIHSHMFQGVAANELLLPEQLEYIGMNAFENTRILSELVLPDTVKVINGGAFNNYNYIQTGGSDGVYFTGTVKNPVYYNRFNEVVDATSSVSYSTPVRITKLPRALEYVGGAAFYADEELNVDFDLPNLKVVGYSAFQGTTLRNIKINSKIASIREGAFFANNGSRNLVFDGDVFKAMFNPNDYYSYNSTRWPFSITGQYSYSSYASTLTFYTYFAQLKWSDAYNRSGWRYQPDGDEYDSIVFTEKATTGPSAAFNLAYYKIQDLDLSRVEWSNFAFGMFSNAEISEVKLPIYLTLNNRNDVPFWHASIDKVILPEGANGIQSYLFQDMYAREVVLPSTLKVIGASAFFNAQIEEELVLPEGLITVKDNAFNSAQYLSTVTSDNPEGDTTRGTHVRITKLPESLETVGYAAFFGNYLLDADLDLPNLKSIGQSAFMKTSLRNVKLYDTLETIESGAFQYIPTLNNLTFDLDYFGVASRCEYCYSFYSVFSSTPRYLYSQTQNVDKSTFGDIIFTEKNVTNPSDDRFMLFFTANKIDIGNTKWTIIPNSAFFKTIVAEPVTIPATVTRILAHAFQEAELTLTNPVPEGVTVIDHAAFFAADITDNMVIPSTVTNIGTSAFNAGSADVYYDTVTIKPENLNYGVTSGQAIFQMFWNNQIDKLIVDSEILPVMTTLVKSDGKYVSNSGTLVCVDIHDIFDRVTSTCHNSDDEETPVKHMPEFHGMTMREVVLNGAGAIMTNAFEENANLEKVDLSQNSNLQFIGRNAFAYDDKLKTVVFGEGLAGKDVSLGEYAFRGTAIETIGDAASDFNLTAANFNTVITDLDTTSTDNIISNTDSFVFAEMPALRSVSVPSSFAYRNVPAYTFANDPELTEATLEWQLESIDDGTFMNDAKLSKLFVWGDTNIVESDEFLAANPNTETGNVNNKLTVPSGATIFAYSDAPAEDYANAESRNEYEGVFYALDEVLYLATNKNFVILNDDKTDFEKEGLKLYAQRRDGVILESDNWQEYTTAFPRTNRPDDAKNITFEEGRGRVGSDEADIAGTVYDAPKPFSAISLANQNYANVSYEMLTMPSSENPLVIINYPDGYTGNVRKATLVSKTKDQLIEEIEEIITPTPEPEPEPKDEPEEELTVPDTGAFGAIAGAAVSSISIATIVVLGGIYLAKRFRK